MRTTFPTTLLTMILLSGAVAGCVSEGAPAAPDGPTPPVTLPAGLVVASLDIVPALQPERPTLYEDDEALVRALIRPAPGATQPETAFVTYLVNDRIMSVEQVRLAPGEEKTMTRVVKDLRAIRQLDVEVRVNNASMRAEATIHTWPRAGSAALTLGALAIRSDFGILHQDGRAVVNVTSLHTEPGEDLRDLHLTMLCLTGGIVGSTPSIALDMPAPGGSRGVDAHAHTCPETYYGLEFRVTAPEGERMGRLLYASGTGQARTAS